jgi:hypothetical protein
MSFSTVVPLHYFRHMKTDLFSTLAPHLALSVYQEFEGKFDTLCMACK